jgi:hypothetical protein
MSAIRRALQRTTGTFAVLLLALLIAAPAAIADLLPDPSFGGDGFALLDEPIETKSSS